MKHDVSEGFFLTAAEYAVLLAGKGIRQIYTLQAQEEKLDESQVCLAMNHLYQTHLLDSTGEQFVLREELEELILGIKAAEYVLLLRPGRREEQALCCFGTEHGFTAVKISEADVNSYQMFALDFEALLGRAMEELEEEQAYEPVLEEEELYRELRNSRKNVAKESIRRYHNLSLVIERINLENGLADRKLLVRLSPEGKRLDVMQKGKAVLEDKMCDAEALRAGLGNLVEKEED